MPSDVATRITRNLDLGHGNHLLEIHEPDMARTMQPGQFMMIGIPGSETLLRRPYSVCGLPGTFDDAPPGALHVLYKVVGTGTRLLASLRAGATLAVLGPLGTGFDLSAEPERKPVLVAGGIGIAPFPAVAARLAAAGRPPTLLYGARSSSDLPLLDWFGSRTADRIVTTDDGTAGRKGLVTDALRDLLRGARPDAVRLLACGPEPMLRAVARIAVPLGVRCDVSLEAHMACGFGVCLGCVVPVRDGATERYDRVCVEGPVMRAEDLAW